MMKSFFKKLAFVMALAMVVSLAAPAATTASAASNLKIAYQNGSAISEVNIAKVGGTEDLKFTGAPSDWKTLGVKWSSNNEAVATVDKAGVVTAVSAGTAVIAVQVGADQATVKVNVVDLPVYTATMGTTDNRNMTELTLEEVGAEFDLAFFGIKDYDKNRYNCDWYSVDEDVATVDEKGLVKATGEGKTKISLGVYNVVTGKKHKVDSCTVVVGAAEPTKAPVNKDAFTVAQKDTDKFVLTFTEAKTADAINDGLAISVKIGDQDYPISFENVTVDGKNVTVTTYAQFENDEVYTLTFGKEVVKHTIVLGDIASVGVNYYTGKNRDNKVAFVAEEEENDYVTLVPVLYDQYGNDVTAKYDLTTFDFTYEVSNNVDPILAGDNDVYAFGAAGVATVNVTAEWFPEDADDVKTVTGKTTFVVEKRGKIGFTLVKAGIANVGGQADDEMYAVLKGTDSKFESFRKDPKSPLWDMWGGSFVKSNLTFDSNETWAGYVYTAVFKDNRGNLITSNNDAYLHGSFSYESTNNNVLSVADGTGTITVYKSGKANILVYFEPADGTASKKLVASTSITVAPEVYPVSFKVLDPRQTTASAVVDEARDGDLNDVRFRVQFLDQNGNPYVANSSEIEKLIKITRNGSNEEVPEDQVSIKFGNTYADKWYWVTLDGSDYAGELGTNTYKKFDFKVSLRENDAVSTVKTKSAILSLTVRNTAEEAGKLASFIASTASAEDAEGNIIKGNIGDYQGTVAPNYKFNIAFTETNTSKDVAVKNVTGYNKAWAHELKKTGNVNDESAIKVTYQSTGNLNIAYVPAELLVDAEENVATNHAGYVYYKISAPSKTTVAGKTNVDNEAWDIEVTDGKIKFWFNDLLDHPTKTEPRQWFEDVENPEKQYPFVEKTGAAAGDWPTNGSALADDTKWGTQPVLAGDGVAVQAADLVVGDTYKLNDASVHADRTEVTYKTGVVPVQVFRYAGKGSYNVSFSTTGKEGGNLSKIKTSSFTVTNSQSEMKYLGLNPDYAGVTENYDFNEGDVLSADTLKALISEQLRFSYDDLLLGEYYESVNSWDVAAKNGWNYCVDDIVVNTEACKYTCSNDSIIITKLAFDVALDGEGGAAGLTYTTVVNVGVRIKEKKSN